VALESYSEYAIKRIAAGYVKRFGELDIVTSQTRAGFGTVEVDVISSAVPSATVHSGIMQLPGGRTYSPWSKMGKRAPVFYPRYTQQLLYRGHADACLWRYQELLFLAGMTAALHFSFGRRFYNGAEYYNYDHYGAKYCLAMLESVSMTVDRDAQTKFLPLHKTHFTATAVWQQVEDFVIV